MSDYFYDDSVEVYYGHQQEPCYDPSQTSHSVLGAEQGVSDCYMDDYYDDERNYMRTLSLASAHPPQKICFQLRESVLRLFTLNPYSMVQHITIKPILN